MTPPYPFRILSLHHVQLAMPAGAEERAREFYRGVLGFAEVAKPERLRARGGCWFRSHEIELHLGVDPNSTPAQKVHPAFLTENLVFLAERLRAAGVEVTVYRKLAGFERFYCPDPFGNRLEFLER